MAAYYNEIDPYAAQWLRNLIVAGHIAPGDVDERSIVDVQASDLTGYTQCHFFAGIGGWSYAMRLAGWDDARPVWTGSCPCQPFSVAGKAGAQKDERHLWPAWFRLIATVRPSVVFGEQVAGAIAHGWLDDTFDDLEREGYETGAAVLPACSVGAPHKRDRLWFVGVSDSTGWKQGRQTSETAGYRNTTLATGSNAEALADSSSTRSFSTSSTGIHSGKKGSGTRNEQFIGCRYCGHNAVWHDRQYGCSKCGYEGRECETFVAYANEQRSQGRHSGILQERPSQCTARPSSASVPHPNGESQDGAAESRGECGHWFAEPTVGRVANGIPARAHKLRAYGNAIVPQVAAEFIKAYRGSVE